MQMSAAKKAPSPAPGKTPSFIKLTKPKFLLKKAQLLLRRAFLLTDLDYRNEKRKERRDFPLNQEQ